MSEKKTLAVTMTRDDWQTIAATIQRSQVESPVFSRLLAAIDATIDASTAATLAEIDKAWKGE